MAAAREHIKAWWLPDPSKATEGTSQRLSPMAFEAVNTVNWFGGGLVPSA